MTSVEEIKKAIEALPPAEKRRLLAEVIPGLSKELLRDEELHHEVAQQVKLFGKTAKDMIGKRLSRRGHAPQGGTGNEEPSK